MIKEPKEFPKAPKTKEELWSFWFNRFTLAQEAKRVYENQWLLNIAFLMGYQFTWYDSDNKQKFFTDSPTTDNKILPKWRRSVGDLVKRPPTVTVLPNTVDEKDINAAKVGTKVTQAMLTNTKVKQQHRKLAEFVVATGNGFLDDVWDNRAGPAKFNPETGVYEHEGDVRLNFLSPFDIFPEPVGFGTKEFQDLQWYIKAFVVPLATLEQDYPNAKLDSEKLQLATNRLTGFFSSAEQHISESVVLMDCYQKPCKEFPKGMFCKCANGKILEVQEYPFEQFHITHFKDISLPGQFWGMGTVEPAIRIQTMWNETLKAIVDYNNLCGKGKILMPNGSDFWVEWDDEAGQIIHYTPSRGAKPELLSLKGMPPTFTQTLQLLSVAMEDLFSQHEVTRGTNKSDIRSGTMLNFLREQDFSGMWPMYASYEEKEEELLRRILLRIQAGYKTDRIIHYMGAGSDMESFNFKGTDLRNNVNVVIVPESTKPDSAVAKEDSVYRKVELGLYDMADPTMRRSVLKQLDSNIDEDVYSDISLNERYADLENSWIMHGFEEPDKLVNYYDIHQIHIQVHMARRLQSDYQEQKVKNPKQFALMEMTFDQHIFQHNAMLMQQLKERANG